MVMKKTVIYFRPYFDDLIRQEISPRKEQSFCGFGKLTTDHPEKQFVKLHPSFEATYFIKMHQNKRENSNYKGLFSSKNQRPGLL